jgi:phage shock protein A
MAYKTTKFSGDLLVTHNASVGNKLTVRGDSLLNDVKILGTLDCASIKNFNQGLFETFEDLVAVHPAPEPGWVAFVGNAFPAKLYVFSPSGWKDTGTTGGSLVGDVAMYSKQVASLNSAINEVNANFADEISAIEATVSTISATSEENKEVIMGIQSDIKDLQHDSEQYEWGIQDNARLISNLKKEVNSHGSSILQTTGAISDLEEDASDLKKKTNALHNKVGEIEAKNEAQEIRIEGLEASVVKADKIISKYQPSAIVVLEEAELKILEQTGKLKEGVLYMGME